MSTLQGVTESVKTVSERVREYRQELDQRGQLRPDERVALVDAYERDLEARWLANGGEPDDFEAEWPRLQREWLSKQAVEGRDELREQIARRVHNNF